MASLLEAFAGQPLPAAVQEHAVFALRYGSQGEIGRARTALSFEAAIQVAHRCYKRLLPHVQADQSTRDPALNPYRRKRYWQGPPSERAFQLVMHRYRYFLPDREEATLRRLICTKPTKMGT
ncbi:MAG TPA: hypothetical protein VIL09_02635 [Microvirga sp.]